MQRVYSLEAINLIGQKVKLGGWVGARRDHGKVIFIDLRDKSGMIQLVFDNSDKEIYKLAETLRSEWVILVEGEVKERPEKMINPNLATGKVEVMVTKLEVLSMAQTLPFDIDTDGYQINEEKRLRYRYLDLRRDRLKKNLVFRHKIIQFIREKLTENEFLEIETPILTKSTPEGARDYIVPARLNPGQFYALPQSPQQYKQLLMVAGIEKYFQIARCFRDEDTRGDRQPEFTQLDIEVSFWTQAEILELVENLFISIIKKFFPDKFITQLPFPRLTYDEAIRAYQTDRPDLRKAKDNPSELAFSFIVDFPMFEWRKKEKRWDSVHHPFTRPQTEDIEEIKSDPSKILAYQYDVVLNGQEIGGGSLRTYKTEILEAVFEVMGHKKENIENKFWHLLEAFKYGVPPHGGIAIGLDRFLAILTNEQTIREVIAFPKTGDGRDLMMDAPAKVEEEQLKELKIKILNTKS